MFNKSKELQDIYNEDVAGEGEQYQIDRYYEPKELSTKRRIDIILGNVSARPGERILDIGCGVGTFAFHLSKFGAVTYGIDYSFESLKMAQKLVSKYNTAVKAKFILADATRIPFQDCSFDKIVVADFIEHISHGEKEQLLKEIYRILKPQAVGIIFTPNGVREKFGNFYWQIRNRLFGDKIPFNIRHFGLINKDDFEYFLRKYKFKFKLIYKDITRPYLVKLPLIRDALSLNLLWIIRKE